MTSEEAFARAVALFGPSGFVLCSVAAKGDAASLPAYTVGRMVSTFYIEGSGASWEEAFAAYERRTTRNRVIEAFDQTVCLVRESADKSYMSLSGRALLREIAAYVADKRNEFERLTVLLAEEDTK